MQSIDFDIMLGNVSALSLATAACQFLEYTTALVSGVREIRNSSPEHNGQRMSYLSTIIEGLEKIHNNVQLCLKS